MLKRKELLKLAQDLGYFLEKQDGSHMIYGNAIGLKMIIVNHQNTSGEMSVEVTNSVLDHLFVTIFLKSSESLNFEINDISMGNMRKEINGIKCSEIRERLLCRLKVLNGDKGIGMYKFLSNKAKGEIEDCKRNHEGAIEYISKKTVKVESKKNSKQTRKFCWE